MVDIQPPLRSLNNDLQEEDYQFRPGPQPAQNSIGPICKNVANRPSDATSTNDDVIANESSVRSPAMKPPLLNGFAQQDSSGRVVSNGHSDSPVNLAKIDNQGPKVVAAAEKSLEGAAAFLVTHDYFVDADDKALLIAENGHCLSGHGSLMDQTIKTSRNSVNSHPLANGQSCELENDDFGADTDDAAQASEPALSDDSSTPLVARRHNLRPLCAGSAPLLARCSTPSAATATAQTSSTDAQQQCVNVKFAQTTPPNSCVDMSSNDYLPDCTTSSNTNVQDTYSAQKHHKTLQDRYKAETRKRHYTDPVDFEGILRIIGGCGRWQLWIYLLISLQQVPHAMFNLNIIYMMFKPDHWCYQSIFDPVRHENLPHEWLPLQVRNLTTPVVYDPVSKQMRFDGCRSYVHEGSYYHDLSHMTFPNATLFVNSSAKTESCREGFSFDDSVMKETIVTQFGLVCAKNMHRADAQLAYALGYFIGCLVGGYLSDKFGRKVTLIGAGILASMFGILLPFTNQFALFLLVRFLSAVCNEAADLAAYVLCMEITGTNYRSTVGSFLQLPWAIGYTLLAGLAYLTRSWRTIQILTAMVHAVAIFLLCMVPESPRWLIVSNRVREAEVIIRNGCRWNKSELPADLELVKHAERRTWVKYNERANILHLWKSLELVTRTIVVFVIWIATALVYYGISLNLSDQSAPGGKMFSGDFFVNNAIAGAVEIPTLLACCVILRYGRRRSQMITLILSGIMMLGVVLSPAQGPSRLLFMLLGKMFIQGAFNILYIFTSELYPTVIRNSAVGTCSMVARLGSGITGYVALLSDVALPTLPMLIFGVLSLVAGLFVMLLPETRDKPLPETLHDAVVFLKPRHGDAHSPTACLGLRHLMAMGRRADNDGQDSWTDSCGDRTLPRGKDQQLNAENEQDKASPVPPVNPSGQ